MNECLHLLVVTCFTGLSGIEAISVASSKPFGKM